ncbi:CRISPR-associated protein, Csm4 family [Desulfothermus naphthae]
MKLLQVGIKPESAFGTPLKGDTIFGHFIWQLVMDNNLLKVPLEDALLQYKKSPFIVFSSAYTRLYKDGEYVFFLKRPDLPLLFLKRPDNDIVKYLKNRKELKSKKFIQVGNDLKISFVEEDLFSETDIFNLYKNEYSTSYTSLYLSALEITQLHTHNKINRLTSSTGRGFAPYTLEDVWYLPYLEMCIFVLFDPEIIDREAILEGLARIGQMGFGRDASSGLGRFSLVEEDDLNIPDYSNCNGLYTLSPCVPDKSYDKVYFQPFVRFGRHGNFLATSRNPFKNPILMMDEGCVIIHREKQITPYIGLSVDNLSKEEKGTVSQGYSIVFPIFF